MKQVMKTVTKMLLTVLAFFTGTLYVLAQDAAGSGSSSVTSTHTETTTWYAQPWVWIVGAALFILLLVALLRGNRSVTKTTTTERNDI
jgi:hypothetical protein